MGLITFLSSIGGSDGISHLAHLGGLVVGYLYLRLGGAGRGKGVSGRGSGGGLRETYHRWRMKRLRKKFERYYEDRTGGGDYKYH